MKENVIQLSEFFEIPILIRKKTSSMPSLFVNTLLHRTFFSWRERRRTHLVLTELLGLLELIAFG